MSDTRYDPFGKGEFTGRRNGPEDCPTVQAAFEYRTPCDLPRDHDGTHQFDSHGTRGWATRPWEQR